MRLLVVEDEKDMNRIIVKELESEGYLVDSCFDGESAFDYLCMAEYDGAILDTGDGRIYDRKENTKQGNCNAGLVFECKKRCE